MPKPSKSNNREVYTQKTGSAYRIQQTIGVLANSKAEYKAIRVPKKDKNIVAKIIKTSKLKDTIKVEVI